MIVRTRPKLLMLPALVMSMFLLIGMTPAAARKGKPPPEPEPNPVCETVMTFSGGILECDWTPVEEGDTGTVHVEVLEGQINNLVVHVRDSAPGDFCGGTWGEWRGAHEPGATFDLSFDLRRGDDSYWASPVDWCGTEWPDTDDALVVGVGARAKKGTQVRVTLRPRQQ